MAANSKRLFYSAAALIIGGVIGWAAKSGSTQKNNQGNTMQSSTKSSMQKMNMANSQSQSTINQLKAKQGVAFDAAFANAMISHHMAATAMAQFVDTEAPHAEIKTLAANVITSQTKEIGDLQTFALQQGYDLSPPDTAMINNMTASLTGKVKADLERQFMMDMIKHHQNAIDMAKLAPTNAASDTIKTMAGTIITAQTKEINDLKAWGGQWGYNLN